MKLVLAILGDDNKIEKFKEIDMEWVKSFNDTFEKNDIPYKETVYKSEFIELCSANLLDSFVQTQNDEQFKVDSTPLKEILQELFDY